MFKALGCLALTMTACAALLSWIAPPDPLQKALSDQDHAQILAIQAVRIEPAAIPATWRAIEIVPPSPVDPHRPTALTATVGGENHFIVSAKGVVQSRITWRRQLRCTDRPVEIVVSLFAAPTANRVSLDQWIGLSALLSELRTIGDLPIRVRPPADGVPPEWLASLNTWLTGAGFSAAIGPAGG